MDEKIIKEILFEGGTEGYTWKNFKKEYNKKREELEQIEKQKKIKSNLKLIGKCYKFHNSFGGEKWWLYIQIVGLNKDGDLFAHKFQKDCYGDITIEADSKYSEPDNEYIPISKEEYKKATELILQEIMDVKL